MMYVNSIEIYTGEDHLKSGLKPVKVLDFREEGHDESKLIERAVSNAKQNMKKYGLSKGIAVFKINRVTEITVYNEDDNKDIDVRRPDESNSV